MDIWIGKITGQPTPDAWVQVHDFTPADENQLLARGRLVAVVGFNNVPEAEVSAQGREVLTRLNELYYGNLEEEVLTQLKKAVATVQEEFDQDGKNLECVCLILHNDLVYVVRLTGGVWVQIEDKEGWLAHLEQEGMQTVSGPLRPGMNLVMGNTHFWQGMSQGVLKAALRNPDHEQMLETVGSVVNGNTSLKNSAAAVIQVLSPKIEEATVSEISKPRFNFKIPNVREVLKLAPKVYINDESRAPKRKRTLFAGVGFLIILLLLVGAWQFRKKQIAEKSSLKNTAIESLLYKYREALAVSQLNPARSRQLVQEVQTELAQLPVVKGENKDPRLAEIETGLPQVLGVATGTKTPEVFVAFDLGLVRQDLVGSIMRQSEGNLVVLDNNSHRLVVVDPAKKKGDVIVGAEALGNSKSLATYPSKIEVVSDKGIVECQLTISAKCDTVLESDDPMSAVVDIAMFGGNIYLLNKSSLWRYQVAETGFGNAQNWLAESESPDFSTAQSLTIDGSIWVGKMGGVIEKYVRGVKDNFNVQDLDSSIGQKINLYTDEDSTKLYVMDADNNRIVALQKDSGEFDSQYKINEIKDVTSFVVDEKSGVIYLLAGSKILGAKL